MLKKLSLSLLTLVLLLSPAPAYAAGGEADSAAGALYQLGLFRGCPHNNSCL